MNGSEQVSEQRPERISTKDESVELQEKLLGLRERLSERHRSELDRIIAGADAAFRLLKPADPADQEAAQFWKAIMTFRDQLPTRQRDAFTSTLAAGSVAWGVAAGRGGEEGGLESAALHLLVPAAVIVALGSLVVRQIIKNNTVPAEPPDLTGIKPSPEEPGM